MKETVKIRKAERKDGIKSLYLDIARQSDQQPRRKIGLGLYLVPAKTELDKTNNRNSMTKAQKHMADALRYVLDTGRTDYKPCSESKERAMLSGYIKEEAKRKVKEATRLLYETAGNSIKQYKDIELKRANAEYLEGYLSWLSSKGRKPNTLIKYSQILHACFSSALKRKLIKESPFDSIDKDVLPKGKKKTLGHDKYLTLEEVRQLACTEAPNNEVKRAFLFSCCIGFRLIDIESLTSANFAKTDKGYLIRNILQKTSTDNETPLTAGALKWLPDISRLKDGERVFRLPSRAAIANNLNAWAKRAGIKKRITFHCARHTFATLLISSGADLGTVCKLLGHSDIRTTMIYAQFVDAVKREALENLPGF